MLSNVVIREILCLFLSKAQRLNPVSMTNQAWMQRAALIRDLIALGSRARLRVVSEKFHSVWRTGVKVKRVNSLGKSYFACPLQSMLLPEALWISAFPPSFPSKRLVFCKLCLGYVQSKIQTFTNNENMSLITCEMKNIRYSRVYEERAVFICFFLCYICFPEWFLPSVQQYESL